MHLKFKTVFLCLYLLSAMQFEVMGQQVSPSLKVKCEYTECLDKEGGLTCLPRTEPTQSFDILSGTKQVKDSNGYTYEIIRSGQSGVRFGRTYDGIMIYLPDVLGLQGRKSFYDRKVERYDFNTSTYSIIKEKMVYTVHRTGDLEYGDKNPNYSEHIRYKGRCVPIQNTTKEQLY
jgi:hypothetical protein